MTDSAFDLAGDLPEGTTVLEASAGTGKTYTIAGLAARYVADGVPLDRLLLVTFTRMATGELRERVRARLTQVAHGLAGERVEPDPVVDVLRARPDRDAVLIRLRSAVADFDAATIATTHAFCQEMLGGLGIAGDLGPDFSFVEEVRDLRSEVVDDLYVQLLAAREDRSGALEYLDAKTIARVAIDNPVTPLVAPHGDLARKRVRLAVATRKRLEERKARMGIVTYDDLITLLAGALRNSPEAVALLHDRYDVVLVDEFQDTDPTQWEILQAAFGDRRLVLIGDPKQAIYAFRGADVFAYLDAAGSATRATLDVNHRSDQRLIEAYDALFDGVRLGHPEIAYLPVTAKHTEPRLTGVPSPAALRVRIVPRVDLDELTARGYAKVGPAREHVATDVAADIAALLSCETARIGEDRVKPGDVAVLVNINRRAAEVRDALQAAGIPAVINGAGSVFGSEPAQEWLRLLEALERPSHNLRAHAAALTCFLGYSAQEVAEAGEATWAAVHDKLHDWARVLRSDGVATLLETITAGEALSGRVLAEVGGERRLTDIRHVGELLHAAVAAEGLGTTALTVWLRRRILEAWEDSGNEDRSRRLESDAQAVQVLTVHRSKGLEFPIVYLPFMWDPGRKEERDPPVVFHDENGKRTLDVTMYGRDYAAHRDRWRDEERGEDLRLLYVALTRAKHQAVVWWAGSWQSQVSPLGRLMFARDGDTVGPGDGTGVPDDATAGAAFEAMAARAPAGCVAIERATLPAQPPRWDGPPARHADLSVARFDRELDRAWRRTSYSALTAAAHAAPRVTSEPETAAVADEPDSGVSTGLWAGVPAGLRVGTAVHRAFEGLDFAAPEWSEDIVALGAVPGLEAALSTPLGAPFGVRLADIGTGDRLDELEFELPLGTITTVGLAAVLRAHGDPYADRLAELGSTEVRGFLTGSVDLVARLPDGRFAIFDYKTNGLTSYAPDALRAEMDHRHYHLQALLYTVALHRYLRWRAPDAAIAGVGYLFLRGMDGTGGAGVHTWAPNPDLVEALSAAFDG